MTAQEGQNLENYVSNLHFRFQNANYKYCLVVSKQARSLPLNHRRLTNAGFDLVDEEFYKNREKSTFVLSITPAHGLPILPFKLEKSTILGSFCNFGFLIRLSEFINKNRLNPYIWNDFNEGGQAYFLDLNKKFGKASVLSSCTNSGEFSKKRRLEDYESRNHDHINLAAQTRDFIDIEKSLMHPKAKNKPYRKQISNKTSDLSSEAVFEVLPYKVHKFDGIIHRKQLERYSPSNDTQCFWVNFEDIKIDSKYSKQDLKVGKDGYDKTMKDICENNKIGYEKYGFTVNNVYDVGTKESFSKPFPLKTSWPSEILEKDTCNNNHLRETVVKVCRSPGQAFHLVENPIIEFFRQTGPIQEMMGYISLQIELLEEPVGGLIYTQKLFHEGDLVQEKFFDSGLTTCISHKVLSGFYKRGMIFVDRDYKLTFQRQKNIVKVELMFIVREAVPGVYTMNMMLSDRFGQPFLDQNLVWRLKSVDDAEFDEEMAKEKGGKVGFYSEETGGKIFKKKGSGWNYSEREKPDIEFYKDMVKEYEQSFVV